MNLYTATEKEKILQISNEELKVSQDINNNLRSVLDTIKERILVSDNTLLSIIAAINSGFNIILYGPPGTAKTTLSEILPRILWNAKCNLHTADSDWSVKKVIGGLTVSYEIIENNVKEIISPKDGYLVDDIYSCYEASLVIKEYDTVFSVIDEFNRTNMDECLGPMFTAMGSDNKILKLDYNKGYKDKPLEIIIPKKYRIICNMNKYDRTFTNVLSEALTRRFKWIFVGSPDIADYQHEKELIKDRIFKKTQPSQIHLNEQLAEIPDYKNNDFFDANISERIFDIMQEIRNDFEIGTSYLIDAIKLAFQYFFLKMHLIDYSGTNITIDNLLKQRDYSTILQTIQNENRRNELDGAIKELINNTIDSSLTMTIAPLFDAIDDTEKLDKIKLLLKDYPLCLNELSRVNLMV